MMTFVRLTKMVAMGGIFTLIIAGTAALAGTRINTTRSIPVGLYWVSDQPAEIGSYILFCPPNLPIFNEAKKRGYISAGFCPGEYSYMMKKILAAKNDEINVDENGVRINQKLIPNTALFKQDGVGRIMPRYPVNSYTLADNELLLMSDVNHKSFDARYFGPIDRSQVETVIRPIFTW